MMPICGENVRTAETKMGKRGKGMKGGKEPLICAAQRFAGDIEADETHAIETKDALMQEVRDEFRRPTPKEVIQFARNLASKAAKK